MALTIYGQAESRAVRALWMAEELGVPYTHIPTRFADEAKGSTFKAVNPNGRVPAIDDSGFVVFESMAINLYLAKRYGGPLAPANLNEDATATQWSFWVMTEIEKTLLQALFHRTGFMGMELSDAKAERYLAELARPLGVLQGVLARQQWLLPDRFTVADLNVACVLAWGRPARLDLSSYPAVAGWLEHCLARPAYARASAIRSPAK